MRLGVPYKVVGGTRFYDRREVKDAMAYLRAVVNPADEVSVKRVLNVPKRGVGDASVAKLDAFAAAEGIGFVDALRHADEAGVTGPAVRGIDVVRRAARPTRRRWPATDERRPRRPAAGRARPIGLPRRARGRGHGRGRTGASRTSASWSARPASSPRIDEFLEQVSLVADTDDLDDDDQVVLMTLHSAKGLEFPVVFLVGVEEGVFPHIRALDRARRAGGGAPPRLRRHHPGPRAAVLTHAWSRSLFGSTQYNPPSRFLDEIPGRARRVEGQRHRPQRRTAARATAPRDDWRRRRRRTAAGAAAATTPTTSARDAHRERVVDAALAAGRRNRAAAVERAGRSGCASATTSSTRRSARA